ncbi:hypothetical protein [Kribbella sp. NPDC050470]|uniref:hypothetical protein n=1 Tax=unclassified Kribbella TaxID=2644121 RepID=UPI0037A475A7
MKYTVSLVGYVGKSVEVEADDWESAVEEVLNGDESYLGLCHQCAGDWDPGDVEAQAVYDEDDQTVAEAKWTPNNLVEVES